MSERRPIASRDTKLAARITRWLVSKEITPNQISQASMAFAAVAGLAFWGSAHAEGFFYALLLIKAAFCCQLRLLCNLFDGMVAVEGGKGAPDGPFWNEAPDRVADALIFVGLGVACGSAAAGWAAAALAIGTAYVRELGSAQGLAADFRGPMAKQQRMAVATGAAVVAIFAPTIWGLSVLALALWIIIVGTVVTIALRSGRLVRNLKAKG